MMRLALAAAFALAATAALADSAIQRERNDHPGLGADGRALTHCAALARAEAAELSGDARIEPLSRSSDLAQFAFAAGQRDNTVNELIHVIRDADALVPVYIKALDAGGVAIAADQAYCLDLYRQWTAIE